MTPGAGTDRAESPVRPGGAPRRSEVSAGWLAFLLNVPTLAGLVLVLAYPICFAGYLSFHEVSIRHLRAGEFPFAGLANFSRLFQDDVFWLSLRHTVVFVVASVALEVVIGLAVALTISDERVWLSRVTRVLILIPWAVPPVVNGLLWSFIVNAQYGYLNRALTRWGLSPTTSTGWANPGPPWPP